MDQEKLAQPDLKVLLIEDDQEFSDILRIRLAKEKNPRLEISERQILGGPSHLIVPVEELKRCGISIAIDDVGFGGNTHLESLVRPEPEVIKLDKKYVHGIAQDPHVERSLQRMLRVAEDLGAEVIAEGIETEEDFARLKEIGVKYGLGYYLGMPA